jgi:hypothetical protein
LSPDGSARVKDELAVTGQSASVWREHYQSPGTQKERYEKAWNESFPGAKALKVELPGLGDLERPVVVRGEVEIPAWGRLPGGPSPSIDGQPTLATANPPPATPPTKGPATGDLVLRPLGREPDLLRSFARLSQRKYDLILGYPWVNQEQVVLELPPAMVARRLPEERQVTSPFGRFELKLSRSGSYITVKALLRIDRHRIGRSDYPAFRRFCADVDSAVAQELVVGHE